MNSTRVLLWYKQYFKQSEQACWYYPRKQGLSAQTFPCVCCTVCSGGCGLKARVTASTDAEGVADGETQTTNDSPGGLRKLYPAP